MIFLEVEIRERTYAAVAAVAKSRGLSVQRMIEAMLIGLAWEESETFLRREVTKLHGEGRTVAWMAASLGMPNNKIQAELRKQGLPANRPPRVEKYHQRKAD